MPRAQRRTSSPCVTSWWTKQHCTWRWAIQDTVWQWQQRMLVRFKVKTFSIVICLHYNNCNWDVIIVQLVHTLCTFWRDVGKKRPGLVVLLLTMAFVFYHQRSNYSSKSIFWASFEKLFFFSVVIVRRFSITDGRPLPVHIQANIGNNSDAATLKLARSGSVTLPSGLQSAIRAQAKHVPGNYQGFAAHFLLSFCRFWRIAEKCAGLFVPHSRQKSIKTNFISDILLSLPCLLKWTLGKRTSFLYLSLKSTFLFLQLHMRTFNFCFLQQTW